MPAIPALRTPTIIAIERLAKLAGQGAPASRMLAALDDILIQWAAENLDPADLRDRVETLQSDIDAGIMAAEDYLAEADTPKGRDSAQHQMTGLTAIRERLADAVGGKM